MVMPEQWDGTHMPTQQGRIGIVTGSNQGIGFACARQLAEHGMHVVLACRNEQRATEAVRKLRDHLAPITGAGKVEYMLVDIGCMDSVKAFSDAVHAKFDRIDLLINNAGVGTPPERVCTDGYAIQFGVNYLGHFHLTNLLLDLLKKSSAARIVNVSSPAHRQQTSATLCQSTKIDFTKVHKGEGDSLIARYEKSKLFNLMFTFELDRRLKATKIRNVQSIGAQPGVCHTNIFMQSAKSYYPRFLLGAVGVVYSYIMQSADMGSLPLLYAATESDVQSAEFFGPRSFNHFFGYPVREIAAAAAYSEDVSQQLWQFSEQLTKTPFVV